MSRNAPTRVSVSHPFKRWAGAFGAQGQKQLLLFVAAQLQTNRGMLFIHEGSYNGHEKWAPLKLRNGQPLRDRGTLQRSIGPLDNGIRPAKHKGSIVKFSGDKVTVGTDIAYARLMNDGGTILPKKSKLLWIPLPEGKNATKAVQKVQKGMQKSGARSGNLGSAPIVRLKNGLFFMLAKKVVIPPRPFDKLNDEDRDEIRAALANEVKRWLSKNG